MYIRGNDRGFTLPTKPAMRPNVMLTRRGDVRLWNETRNAGFHHFIQPLSGLNSIDFVKRVLRKGRDVEILSRAVRSPGRGKQSRTALHLSVMKHM